MKMRKKFARVALIMGLTGVLSINTVASAFSDVPATHWAYTGISYMQEQGYMLKNSAGAFSPNQEVTYFDFAEILAKMAGYKDPAINPNMDPQLKENIQKMYDQQIPYINQYDNDDRYKTWRTSSNEEIAYVLAIGYMNQADLSRFMIKAADGTELTNALTKQDLARYLVFYLGKANTAVAQYQGTGFADEHLIREENRPYVAYLKSLGLVNGDADGNFGANDKVTRALCAAMSTTVISYKEANSTPPATTTPPETDTVVPTPDTTPEVAVPTGITGQVSNVVPRNNEENEVLILIDVNGKSGFYTANSDTVVKDLLGNTIEAEDIVIGDTITFTVEDKILLTVDVENIVVDKDEEDKEDEETEVEEDETLEDEDTEEDEEVESVDTAYYEGEVDRIGASGDITVYTSKGSVTFDMHKEYTVVHEGKIVSLDVLEVGDVVEIKVEDDEIVVVDILEKAQEEVATEFVKVVNKVDNYIFSMKDEAGEVQEIAIEKDKEVRIYRNGEEVTIEELHIGDHILFEEDEDVIEVIAEGIEQKIEGKVESILISSAPEMVVKTDDGAITVAVVPETEIYDSNVRDNVTLRDILLGMNVEVRMDSKEAESIIIERASSRVTYSGTIQEIGTGVKDMYVLIDEDPITGESKVIKHIPLPSDIEIIVDRDNAHRKDLEEGMEVRITYAYSEELYPEEIEAWS